jgi:hypothetical protein
MKPIHAYLMKGEFCFAPLPRTAAMPLPALNVDAAQVTVSDLSSGGA